MNTHRFALLALLAIAPVMPALAEEAGSESPAPLSAPGPVAILDSARAALGRNDLMLANGLVQQAEQRVISDTLANMMLAPEARDAIPYLDKAQQALNAGDRAGAETAIGTARAAL